MTVFLRAFGPNKVPRKYTYIHKSIYIMKFGNKFSNSKTIFLFIIQWLGNKCGYS